MKALIVDDSAIMRKIVAKSLAEADIDEWDEAVDGVDGLAKLGASSYDVVLLDWNMPNMLGIDVLKKMRADGNQTPVIMVTTEAEKGRVIEAIKSGASNYIIKPFEKELMAEKIKATLAK